MAMSICVLLLAASLNMAEAYVTEEEEAHYILQCRAFAQECVTYSLNTYCVAYRPGTRCIARQLTEAGTGACRVCTTFAASGDLDKIC